MSDTSVPRSILRKQFFREAGFVLIAVFLACWVRWYYMPSPSVDFPGISGFAKSSTVSPPPSMDELWHLVLSTGWGDFYATLPDNTIIPDLPPLTSLQQARPWYTVWTSMDNVFHPPLYVQTLRFWRALFGESDSVAIAYSIFWSCISVILVYLVVRLEAYPSIAFMAAVFMAFSKPEIYFGLEIRGYSVLTAFMLLLLYAVMLIRKRGATPTNCAILGSALLGTMFTHYLSLSACLTAAALALWWSHQGQRRRIMMVCVVSGLLFAMTWFPFLLVQLRIIDKELNGYLQNRDGVAKLLQIAAITPLRLFGDDWDFSWWVVSAGISIIAFIVVAGVRFRSTRPCTILFVGVFASMVIQDVANQTMLIAFTRYCTPFFAILIPTAFLLCALLRLDRAQIMSGLLALSSVMFCMNKHKGFPIRNDSPTFYPLTLAVASSASDDQMLIIGYQNEGYLQGKWIAMELSHIPNLCPRDVLILSKPADPEIVASARTKYAWFVPVFRDEIPVDPLVWVPGSKVVRQLSIPGANRNSIYLLQLN